MRIILLSILSILFLPGLLSGQALVGVQINPDSITIGEKTNFIVSIQYPNGYPLQSIDLNSWDSLELYTDPADTTAIEYFADVEWESYLNEDFILPLKQENIVTTGNGLMYKDTLVARIWDTGVFITKPITIVNNDSLVNTDVRFLQSAYVKVYPPMDVTNPDTTKLILPISDIVLEEDTLEDYIHIIYGIALLLGLILFIYLYRKFTREKESAELLKEKEIAIPPHIKALEALDELEKKALWLVGKEKEHQSRLTYILRSYLEDQFNIPALESTTEEIKNALKRIDWDMVRINDVNEILQIADLVKFAKAQPAEDIHQAFIERTRLLVTVTSEEVKLLEESKMDEDE